jgi:hypothetical protein
VPNAAISKPDFSAASASASAFSNVWRNGLAPVGKSLNLFGSMMPPRTKSKHGMDGSDAAVTKAGVAPRCESLRTKAFAALVLRLPKSTT